MHAFAPRSKANVVVVQGSFVTSGNFAAALRGVTKGAGLQKAARQIRRHSLYVLLLAAIPGDHSLCSVILPTRYVHLWSDRLRGASFELFGLGLLRKTLA